jgi:choline kinase
MNSDSVEHLSQNKITTALLLAAGTGSRLYPLTAHAPKCLTLVNGTSILHRLLKNLSHQGFKRLVIVTGHLKDSIIKELGDNYDGISIEYIHNPLYRTTNNIYTLWMARHIMNEPFVLFESDLVLNTSLLDNMMYPDRMAVALMKPWLNGTTVSIDDTKMVTEFQQGTTEAYSGTRYKTVNIYSFSLSSWQLIIKQLNRYISEGIVNCYYENIFIDMIQSKDLVLESISFDHQPWYEIDTIKDLEEAEFLFPKIASTLENVNS